MLKISFSRIRRVVKIINRNRILFSIIFFIVSPFFAQTQNNVDGTKPQAFVRVTVSDERGLFVSGLKSESFKLFEDNKLQPITAFKSVDEPMSVGILLDLSGSMGKSLDSRDSKFNKMKLIGEGISKFMASSLVENTCFLLKFTEQPEIVVDETSDRSKINEEIKRLSKVKPYGSTGFYDALSVGIEKISKSKFDKRVLLVMTDGEDNNSEQKFGEIKKSLKKLDVIIYFVNVFDGSIKKTFVGPNALALSYLDEIAGFTGGRSFHISDKEVVGLAFEMIALELRNQYLIGFTPGKAFDNKSDWRDLKVKVELSENVTRRIGKVYARNRAGYSPQLVDKQ